MKILQPEIFKIKNLDVQKNKDGSVTIMYKGKEIHTDQNTQRNFLYEDEKVDKTSTYASELIDSIVNGNIIPAIIITILPDGEYYCFDGKQRLLTISKFILGALNISKKFTSMSQTAQNEFLEKEFIFDFREVEVDEMEIGFVRMNKHILPLKNYEQLHGAYYGTLMDSIENIYTTNSQKLPAVDKRGEVYYDFICFLYNTNVFRNIQKYLSDEREVEYFKINSNSEPEFKTRLLGLNYFIMILRTILSTNINYNLVYSLINIIYYKIGNSDPNKIKKISDFFENNTHSEYVAEYVLKTGISDMSVNEIFFRELILNNKKLDTQRFFTDAQKELKHNNEILKSKNTMYKCPTCNTDKSLKLLAGDHIIPWMNGGTTTSGNLQLICKSCNSKKGSTVSGK